MLVKALGYVGVESPDAKEWLAFGPEVLGGMEAVEASSGSVLLRIDDADHRLAVHHGERNRMLYAGWDVGSEDALEAAGGELLHKRGGIGFEVGTEEDCAAAGVLGFFLTLSDPSGLRHELFLRSEGGAGFLPARSCDVGGVRHRCAGGVGSCGAGDAGPCAGRPVFAGGVLGGFKKSDEIYTFMDLWFYHCNPRHHSIALTPMPGVRGTAPRDGGGAKFF